MSSLSSAEQLPRGWTSVRVEDLAANEPGSLTDGPFGSNLKTSHYTSRGARVVRLQNVGDGRFMDEPAFISLEHFDRLRRHEARVGDVLVAMLGETLPRACLVPESLGPAIVKADCARLRPHLELADPRYLAAALNSPVLRGQAAAAVHGVGRPRLGLKWLRELEVRLAPLAEQRRIVEALESLLSRLDAAEAGLARVQHSLGLYRASVLQAAVEGRLVSTEAELARAESRDYEPASVLLERILAERRLRWEQAELERMKRAGKTAQGDTWRSRYKEPAAPETDSLPEVPPGWTWATVDQLSTEARYGTSAKTNEDATGVSVLRMGNLVHGVLDFSELKYLPADHHEFPDLYLEAGDLLFNRTNSAELVGKTAVFAGHVGPCSFASYLIRVRLAVGVQPSFVSAYLNSVHGRAWVASVVSQQVGQANVNGSKLKSCAIPLPPREEQRRIVCEMERLLSVARATAESVDRDHQRVVRLRQSVLRWAFEGKLVDQDPADEPASVLLERIRRGGKAAARQAPARRSSQAARKEREVVTGFVTASGETRAAPRRRS